VLETLSKGPATPNLQDKSVYKWMLKGKIMFLEERFLFKSPSDFLKEDLPAFEEFKSILKKYEIDVMSVVAYKRKDSSFSVNDQYDHYVVPYLRIIVNNKESFEKNVNGPSRLGLIKKDIKELVISEWEKICLKYNFDLDEAYDKHMHIGISNGACMLITFAIRGLKEQIITIVLKITQITPKHVFVNSSPGITISFPDKKSYQVSEKYFDKIKKEILEILIKNHAYILESEILNTLNISFLHTDMKNVNWYGLSRED